MTVTLLGPDHLEHAAVNTASCSGWCLSISKGLDSPAPKVDANEDACGVMERQGVITAVVADAHWGAASASAVVQAFMKHGLVRAALEAAQAALRGERSECAWLAVEVRGQDLRWWSQGDCRLYGTHPPRVINPLVPAYFGARLGPRGIEIGSATLSPGERIVLATDGLPECVYGHVTLDAGQIAACVAEAGDAAAEALVRLALSGGGQDNVAVVVSP